MSKNGVKARSILWFLTALVCIGMLSVGTTAQAKMVKFNGKTYDIAEPGDFKPGEVVVKGEPGVTEASVRDMAAYVGAKLEKSVPEYDLHLLTFQAAGSKEARKAQIDQTIKMLRAYPRVENAFPNYKFSIPNPIGLVASKKGAPPPVQPPKGEVGALNTLTPFQWHLYRIKYPFSKVLPTTTPVVAVLDSGVDATHPDLAGNVLTGYDFVLTMPGGTIDGLGHGTHVAGIIAAKSGATIGVMGVSPTSKILPVRVLDNTGSGTYFDIMAGIVWARAQTGVKVLNMSLGGSLQESTTPGSAWLVFKKVIDDTVAGGKVVCVAATNDDNLDLYYYQNAGSKWRPVPAYYPNSFTVAASNEVDCRAYFSNYNATFPAPYNYAFNYVDIVAPGWNVLSTVPGGGHEAFAGTSMATPVVAGCAARVFAANPTYTNLLVQSKLTSTGKALPLGNGFPAYPAAQKRVDLGKALGETKTGLVGVVYGGPEGRPLSGVTVKAEATGGATVSVTSNGAGFFTFTTLTPAKSYNLTFTKTGYSTFSYAGNYAAILTTSGYLNDVLMPVFLNGVRPAGQWSVLLTYHSWHPGYNEAYESYPLKPAWLPINWDQTDGTFFSTKVYRNSTLILADDGTRGQLSEDPFAAITSSPWDFKNPGCNVVIVPKGTNVYKIRTRLDNINDAFYEWGKYKGTAVNATARIYYGSTLKATVKASLATGAGAYWRIADLKPSGVVTILNVLATTP